MHIFKRFNLSVLGNSDVIFESGDVFGKIPYPLLHIHRANQTYAYQLSSYNLMNFMEFMSDRYASVNIQHSCLHCQVLISDICYLMVKQKNKLIVNYLCIFDIILKRSP